MQRKPNSIKKDEFDLKLQKLGLIGSVIPENSRDYEDLWEFSGRYDRSTFLKIVTNAKFIHNQILDRAENLNIKRIHEILSRIDGTYINLMAEKFSQLASNPNYIEHENVRKVLERIYLSCIQSVMTQSQDISNAVAVMNEQVRKVISMREVFASSIVRQDYVNAIFNACLGRLKDFCSMTSEQELSRLLKYVTNGNGPLKLNYKELKEYAESAATFFTMATQEKIEAADKCIKEYKDFIVSVVISNKALSEDKKNSIINEIENVTFSNVIANCKSLVTISPEHFKRSIELLKGKPLKEVLAGISENETFNLLLNRYGDIRIELDYSEMLLILKNGPSNLMTSAQRVLKTVATFDEAYKAVYPNSNIDLNKLVNYKNISGVHFFSSNCDKKNLKSTIEVLSHVLTEKEVFEYFSEDLRRGAIPAEFVKGKIGELIIESEDDWGEFKGKLKESVKVSFSYWSGVTAGKTNDLKEGNKKSRLYLPNSAMASVESPEDLKYLYQDEEDVLLCLEEMQKKIKVSNVVKLDDIILNFNIKMERIGKDLKDIDLGNTKQAVELLGLLHLFYVEARNEHENMITYYNGLTQEEKNEYVEHVESATTQFEIIEKEFTGKRNYLEQQIRTSIKHETDERETFSDKSIKAQLNRVEALMELSSIIDEVIALVDESKNSARWETVFDDAKKFMDARVLPGDIDRDKICLLLSELTAEENRVYESLKLLDNSLNEKQKNFKKLRKSINQTYQSNNAALEEFRVQLTVLKALKEIAAMQNVLLPEHIIDEFIEVIYKNVNASLQILYEVPDARDKKIIKTCKENLLSYVKAGEYIDKNKVNEINKTIKVKTDSLETEFGKINKRVD